MRILNALWTLVRNHKTCTQLRGMMRIKTVGAWGQRIVNAEPDELRKIIAELTTFAGYQGRVILQSSITESGRGQAEIFLRMAYEELFRQEIREPAEKLEFPYPSNPAAADKVLRLARAGLEGLFLEQQTIVNSGMEAALNTVLNNNFHAVVVDIFFHGGKDGQIQRLYEESQIKELPIETRNIILLKFLEMIEAEKGDPFERAFAERGFGSQSEMEKRTAACLGERIPRVLEHLPVDKLKIFSPQQAAVAMLFLFQFEKDELSGIKNAYVFDLIAAHPNPDELVREYWSLSAIERIGLFALKALSREGQSLQISTKPYDDNLVRQAIAAGEATCFRDVLRLGLAKRFFS